MQFELKLNLGGLKMATSNKIGEFDKKQFKKEGKVRFVWKNKSLDLTKAVNLSLDEAVVTSLDAMLDKAEVSIDEGKQLLRDTILLNPGHTVELVSQWKQVVPTLVIPVTKKKMISEGLGKIMDDYDMGVFNLFNSSTLPLIYKHMLGDKWIKLNNIKDNKTNVLYVPNVVCFGNANGIVPRNINHVAPLKVNVLMVAFPKLEEETEVDKLQRVICDIMDAAAKSGSKDLIIAPYIGMKLLEKSKEPVEIANNYNKITSSKKAIDTFNSIYFSIDDDKFIPFRNVMGDNIILK